VKKHLVLTLTSVVALAVFAGCTDSQAKPAKANIVTKDAAMPARTSTNFISANMTLRWIASIS
jgi:hypothetical protein